jgi:two-component system NtrC family sensor kinase
MIEDTGEGIAAENLTKIFAPDFTTKPLSEGTGLGLAICSTVCASHGGTIDVQSEPGVGSTFTVWLPLEPPCASSTTPGEAGGR